MAFPTAPSVGDTYTTGGRVYRWTGYAWDFAESVSPHAGTHAATGSDPVAISASQVSGLSAVATSGSAADLTGTLADARLTSNIATTSAVSAAQAYAIQRGNHTGTQAIGTVSGLQAALDGKQPAGSYATLDGGGKVPAAQLPSYVDDVLEYASLSAFPATGETGKIYTATDTNKIYRWSGSTYIEISPSPGSTDSVAEGSTNLYYTTARASAAAPVQSVAGRTGNVTLTASDISGLGSLATQSSVAYSSLTGAPALATVATSGSAADLTGTLASSRLPASGVTAGTYGSASTVPVVAVDSAGRVTSATSTAIAISASAVSGLASVATSGAYSSLSGRPTIPTTDGGTYTGTQSLTYTSQPSSVTVARTSPTTTAVTLPSAGYYYAIAYGAGLFVSPNWNSGLVAVSSDGLSWSQSSLPANTYWNSVAYGNGVWILLADGGTSAFSSADAGSWYTRTLPATNSWRLAYGNERFVAVGYQTAAAIYSADGTSWTTASMPSSENWQSVAYGGTYVAIALDSTATAYSTTGVTWFARSMPSRQNWYSVAYGGGLFVAVAYGSTITAVSSDQGYTWTQYSGMPSAANWTSVTYGNGVFLAVASGGTAAAISTDGQTWSSVTLPSSAAWQSVAYGGGRFVAATSANAATAAAIESKTTLTAAATTSYGVTPSVSWQRSTDSGSTWSALSTTGGTLSLSGLTTADNGNQYRAIATAYGSPVVASNAATLTIT